MVVVVPISTLAEGYKLLEPYLSGYLPKYGCLLYKINYVLKI